MNKKYLIVLKNPPASFMIDGFDNDRFLKDVKNIGCLQENLSLWIPTSSDCNISYIQEMTEEEVIEFEARIAKLKAKLVKAQFIDSGRKPN